MQVTILFSELWRLWNLSVEEELLRKAHRCESNFVLCKYRFIHLNYQFICRETPDVLVCEQSIVRNYFNFFKENEEKKVNRNQQIQGDQK